MMYRTRFMIQSDLRGVLGIESVSFPEPWDLKDFQHCMNQKHFRKKVIEEKGEILGYIVYELSKDAISLVNMAVAPEVRRQGIGRTLVEDAISALEIGSRKEVRVHASERNLEMHLFLRSLGFKATKVERRYFSNNEDSYLFCYKQGRPYQHDERRRLDEVCQGK